MRAIYTRKDGGLIGDVCRKIGDKLGIPRRPWRKDNNA